VKSSNGGRQVCGDQMKCLCDDKAVKAVGGYVVAVARSVTIVVSIAGLMLRHHRVTEFR
jgi:hypothetical protein